MLRTAALACLLVAVPTVASGGRERLIASFEDDPNDVQYQKPLDGDIERGDFDLRRFEVWLDGDDVLFKVAMASSFRQPAVTTRTTETFIPLDNQITLQNIDIYIDTDRAAAGYAVCIPGRRVAFADGRTWKVAVVLTPQPGLAQNVTDDALGAAAKHVLWPKNLHYQGRTVFARVPAAALGGVPQRSWGYSVHVSGAAWDRSYAIVDRLANGKPEPDAFTMPVLGLPEAWAFGGAPEGTAHPRVVDVLLPRGADQKKLLGAFKPGEPAKIPFVELEPSAAPPAPPPAVAAFTVVDLAGKTVTVGGPTEGLRPLMLGRVLDGGGATVGHVTIVRVLEAGLVCEIVDGAERIARGAQVRFDPGN